MSYTYTRALLTGDNDINGITLKTLSKMFPNATISFDGNGGAVSVGGAANTKGTNNSSANGGDGSAVVGKIKDAIMLSDMSAEQKVKAYAIISQTVLQAMVGAEPKEECNQMKSTENPAN